MADIFLSYASQDLQTILPLARALEQEGWSVFWDREIPLGKTWRQVLDKELSVARCVVVVWTEASVDRRWVLEESEEAQRRGILIPVFMDRVEAPRGFREVQGALLLGWKGKSNHEEFVRLCGACREIIGAPGSPTPPHPLEPEISKPKKLRLGWIALALGLVLVAGGAWLWYQTTKRQAAPVKTPVDEPIPAADSLPAALQYQEACNRGSALDCNNLGDLYSAGLGVAEDQLRAAALYQQACDGKIARGCINLGALFEEGRGVAKDEERAAKLYQQACDDGAATGCERLELLSKRPRRRTKEPTRTGTEARAAKTIGTTSKSQAEKRAQLRITVSPWGDVWIDGEDRHRAPWNLSLKPGTYTIRVGRGTPTTSRVVRLKPGDQKTEHFDLSD